MPGYSLRQLPARRTGCLGSALTAIGRPFSAGCSDANWEGDGVSSISVVLQTSELATGAGAVAAIGC